MDIGYCLTDCKAFDLSFVKAGKCKIKKKAPVKIKHKLA